VETQLEVIVGKRLRKRGLKLAVAESCTGGLVGHRLTNIAGSSDYYLGSVTAYANEIKERLLGVHHETLLQNGAVSRPTVLEMAAGVRRAMAAVADLEQTIGLSISGIAGPGGDTSGKPVGLVWIGLSTSEGEWAWENHFAGDRAQIKSQAAEYALNYLSEYLKERTLQPTRVETRAGPKDAPIPLSFTWQGRSYQITEMGRRWKDADGHHFLVMTSQQQTFELVQSPDGSAWYLNTSTLPPAHA
jgi:nicotinamide-nucleotide amidase